MFEYMNIYSNKQAFGTVMSNPKTLPIKAETCAVRMLHTERIARAHKEALAESQLRHLADNFKLMGDPNRLKLLMALRGGEMCVCDLAAFIGVTESAVSHQLRRLREACLVRSRREGQILFYQLADDCVAELIFIAEGHLHEGPDAHAESRQRLAQPKG
jgi:ArsR family transcriptional regulator, lead/cadmium/zinc/bismuth-responsive transcriptional repressor